ncbi:Nn.00g076570.m01.CDS01 [Neocucurbitaria sp. VM-36]
MESWNVHFPQLDARSHFNMTLNTSTVQVPWTQTNRTRALIANLQLAQVQTLRTTHLTLGAFSLALTLLTVHRIVSDARRAAALQVTPRKQRFNALQNVHTAETFPLALACGAVIQQIIFVAVQSSSLHSVISRQCRGLAMITFPAIFVVGYVTLVFGVEMAWRAFKQERFAPRGKWNTTICVGVVSFLLLLTWMPTIAWPMYSRCFGSLIWFPMRYDLLMLVILCVLIFFLLLLAALISIQLMRTPNMDHNERISASRMTYFLLVAALIYILVIPVEIQSLRRDFSNVLSTSRVAEISLFSSGMIITFFHLFLRTNATRMVIRPIEEMKATNKQKRPRIRFFGPSDLEMNISGPMALQSSRAPDSRQGLIDVGPEKNRFDFDPEYFVRPERVVTPASTKPASPIDPTKWPLPPDVEEKKVAMPGHERGKQSYSLFPTRAEDVPRLPAAVYDPTTANDAGVSKLAMRRFTRRSSITNVSEAFDFLTKPKPRFAVPDRHRRDRSTDSSATVQIGLRFSVAPATLAAAKCTRAERDVEHAGSSAPPLKRGVTESSGESLALPIQHPSTTNSSTSEELPSPSAFPQPPPRNTSPTKPRMPSPARTPAFPLIPAQNSSAYLQAQREKVLPPPPPRSPLSTPTTATRPSVSTPVVMSGLRMNPVTPVTSVGSPTASVPSTPARAAPSPTARIPLGAGTMSRSPPPNGWI